MNRKDCLAGRVTHRQYWGEVVRLAGIKFEPTDEVVVAAANSNDEFFNDICAAIPMSRWDSLASGAMPSISKALQQLDDFYSLAGGVCAMKEAVLQAVERRNK